MRANSFAARVVSAARPARPWLHVTASPRVARFLVEAGARQGHPVLHDMGLMGADLRGADLRGADLRRAVLLNADLTGADLTGADLRHAVLSRVDLSDADLRGANLTGADLTGATLCGADLTGADLTAALLFDVLWSDTTWWPAREARIMMTRSRELRPGVWRVAGPRGTSAGVRRPPPMPV